MATSGEQNQDLEEVGRGIGLLNEIEERTGEPDITGYTANPTPSYQSRGRPKFDIHKEQIEHLLNLNFTCPKQSCQVSRIRHDSHTYENTLTLSYLTCRNEEKSHT